MRKGVALRSVVGSWTHDHAGTGVMLDCIIGKSRGRVGAILRRDCHIVVSTATYSQLATICQNYRSILRNFQAHCRPQFTISSFSLGDNGH